MKRLHRYTIAVVCIAALIFLWWSYTNGYVVAYADAKSHLNITRRVFDNTTPGLAQLGGIWLPLLHVLMLPFVLSDQLYYSGLSGAFVNFFAYLVAVSAVYHIVARLTRSAWASAGSALLFGLNANLLYMQTTPMTEVLTIMLISLSMLYFLSWQQSRNIRYLVYLAIILFLGTLTRYEIWSLLPSAVLAIAVTLYDRTHTIRSQLTRIEGHLVLFCSLAFLGVVMWFTWNILLFGSPFYFLKGIYSSKALQVELIKQGLHRPYHNMPSAVQYYVWAMVNTNGWATVLLGGLGSAVYLLMTRTKNAFAFGMFAVSVIAFEIYSMYTGNTTIFVPQLHPFDYFNIRYGLYALPFLSVFAGVLFTMRYRLVAMLAFAALTIATGTQYMPLNPITLADSGFERARAEEHVAALLRNQYRGGAVMAAAGVADPIIFLSRIHIRNYITEGNQKAWEDALKDPTRSVSWIIINTNKENIRNEMARRLYSKHRLSGYTLAYKENDWELYRRNDVPVPKDVAEEKTSEKKRTYRISRGDSLWDIAAAVYGDGRKWIHIARRNGIENPSIIHADNILIIPES